MAGMFDFLGANQYTGIGLRPNQQSPYSDGIGMVMPRGLGLTMDMMPQSFGQMPTSDQSSMMPKMANLAMNLIGNSQQKSTPMVQNNIPMGRNLTYQDIMKMYGIQGLMG